jgi:hypothetical protein
MQIQPKPAPRAGEASRPAEPSATANAAANTAASSAAQTPTPPPHAGRNRTLAGMPDRSPPDWGQPKPQLTVKTAEGELAPIPAHPARMTEGDLHRRYFNPDYAYDAKGGLDSGGFFAQANRFTESPTREAPFSFPPGSAPQAMAALPVRPAGPPAAPAPAAATGSARSATPESDPEEAAPLLPHERLDAPAAGRPAPSPEDRFRGLRGWGRDAGYGGGGNDYGGSVWD